MDAMTENLCFLHERAPNYLHFIHWSHFSNFDHERIMDLIFALFLFNITNFHVITVHSVLGVWILSMYHYTCHDNSYIFYYKSYGPSWIFRKHNVLMSLKFLFDVERWLLVAYHYVIHRWKAVEKHYNLHWKLVGDFSFLRTLWLENWKYCWILLSNAFLNDQYWLFFFSTWKSI